MIMTYAAAMSADQFIAKPDGDVSWLDAFHVELEESGVAELFARVDALVMGRATYDFVFDYGSWPYEAKPAWVCTSSKLKALPGATISAVDSTDAVVSEARRRGFTHLWLLGGGRLASSLLEQGLIDQLSITELPVQLGSGIPLFARHRLEDVPFRDRSVTEYRDHRQLEYRLR